MDNQFKYLFTPIKVGNITLPNRIMMSAHVARFYPAVEAPDERTVYYFKARAKGGVGLIVTGPNFPCWPTTAPFHTVLENDSVIPALKKISDTIHEYGTKVFAQLMHPGNFASSRNFGGGSTFSASAIPRKSPFYPLSREVPHEMDIDDIERTVEAFAKAAKRLKAAEYDGVEIAAMWGMLFNSFLSPVYNKRTDQYGGSIENRMRFLIDTISAIRESVGSDFVIGVRFTGDDFIESGLCLDDAKEIAKRLEAIGMVDYLFACPSLEGSQHIASMYYPLGSFVYIAAGVKEVTTLPVCSVGRINDPVLAEDILANHQADIIAMVRALVADPEMPNKAKNGRLEEIRKCLGCNEGCCFSSYRYAPLTCTMNAEVGKEKDVSISPAEMRKSVMVIGGGAAGLETARVAALRGHRVSLYEKEEILAQDLFIAAKAPERQGWEDARRYFLYQMKLLGVDLHMEVAVTREMVINSSYDAVVVATGAVPDIPELPGANSNNVVEMTQVLQEQVKVGMNVLIIALQHHMHGLQMADFLTEDGKKVQIVTTSAYAGDKLDSFTIEDIYFRLIDKGVIFIPLTEVKEIKGNVVVTRNVLTNVEKQIEGVDTVVFCTERKSNDELYRSLKDRVKELYRVGQCVSPRELLDSIADGYRVGRML